jgi:COMPASS component SWD3
MQSEPARVSHNPEGTQVKQETEQGLQFNNDGPKYQLRFTLSGHRRSVSALKFSPDGSMLASAGDSLVSLCYFH